MTVPLWRAKHAEVYIGDAITTLSTTATIMAQLTGYTTWSGEIKDIEISGGEADSETIFMLGSNTSSQQNAVKEDKPMSDIEFSGNLIFKDLDSIELATADATAVGSTGYERVLGDSERTEKAIVVKFEKSGNIATILLNNAVFTKLGDISVEAEGHAEQEITAKCLAKDYAAEYKASA